MKGGMPAALRIVLSSGKSSADGVGTNPAGRTRKSPGILRDSGGLVCYEGRNVYGICGVRTSSSPAADVSAISIA